MNLQFAANLRKRLRGRQRTYGGWLSIGSPEVASIFAAARGDFIGIDMEHTTIELLTAQSIIRACHEYGRPCLPRVFSCNPEPIRRLLDAGADGIILPQISTREQIDHALEAMHFPPKGKRGFGVAAAQRYGRCFDEYVRLAKEALSLMIQVENIEAVKNVDSLTSHPGVDAVMVGPYDISGSLGVPGQLEHPKVTEACQEIIRSCVKNQKGCGIQLVYPNIEDLRGHLKRGFTFIVIGSDIFNLWKRSEEVDAMIESCELNE